MFIRSRIVTSTLLFVLAMVGISLAGASKEPTVLVVPGRPVTVSVALDVAKLRSDVFVVLYQQVPKTGAIVVHVWDARKQDWAKITLDDYSSGQFANPAPTQIVLIGTDATMMAKMEKASAWGKVVLIQTLDVMSIANTLNEALTFTPGEWKYLAKRNGLKLQDMNEDRRRYGRFGKPGEAEVISGEPESVQPPAPVTTTSEPEPVVVTAPEDK